MRSGVAAARAPLVATLDGDGQNDPSFIPALLHALRAGRRDDRARRRPARRRRSRRFKKLQSRIANGVRGAILRDGTRDTGCGLKVFRRDAFLGAALFRRAASLPARAVPPRRLCHRLCRCDRPAAPSPANRTTDVGPAVGRHPRSCRRVVAGPPAQARAAGFGGLNAQRSSESICTTCSSCSSTGGSCSASSRRRCSACASWCSGSPPSAQAAASCRPRSGCSRSAAACCCSSIRSTAAIRSSSRGRGSALFIYLRNLYFVLREKASGAPHTRLMHRGEAALQVGGQVADIFQSDMEADARPARIPFGRGAGTPRSRTGSRGFRSRPMRRRSRTASAH